jgi:hypothetical protein
LDGLAMENIYIFYGHLVYFTAIWYILWAFGIFCGHLVNFRVIWYNFSSFGMLSQEKSGKPDYNVGQLFGATSV